MELSEINRYCDPHSLLVATPDSIIRIYTPFQVELIKPVVGYNVGDLFWVQQVKISTSLEMIYIIQKQAYYYYLFRIIINDK